MAGIEKITGEIINAANTKAEEIINEAKNQAKAIIEKAQDEANVASENILAAASLKAESVKNAGESACALDKKNKMLKAKMDLINESFEKSIDKLKTLDTKTYFSVIKRLVVYYAVKGEGKLVLSEKDKSKMPSDFISAINKDLSSGKSIVLCDETDKGINGGCVIKYDEIEINCTFDAIINSEKERLIDAVNKVLFN